MARIKLLALDLDGTTLKNDHQTLSPGNAAAIAAAGNAGVQVVVATGRLRKRIPPALRALPGVRYAVTSNGAAVVDLLEDRDLYRNPLSAAQAVMVMDAVDPLGVYLEGYCAGGSYADKKYNALFDSFPLTEGRRKMMTEFRETVEDLRGFFISSNLPIEKINFPYLPPEKRGEVIARLKALDGLCVTSSIAHNAEVNTLTASKADGLSHLCGILGIAPQEVLALGDNENDIEMLNFAGIAAVPENGTPEAKAAADYVTADNEADGVAKAIERFILNV